MGHQLVRMRLEVAHHGQLRVGEVGQDEPAIDAQPRHPVARLQKPIEGGLHLPWLVNGPIHSGEQLLRIEVPAEVERKDIHQAGVRLGLVGQLELELVLRRAKRPEGGAPEQHRGRGLPFAALVLPRGQTQGKVQR